MIRKTLIVGIVVLAALAAAAPALVGFYLEREFDAALARIADQGTLRVISSDFERGWFASDARLRLGLGGALCDTPPCAGIALTTRVHHGPIPFNAPVDPEAGLQPSLGVAVTRLDPAALWPRLIFEPALEPLRIVTRVGFDTTADSTLAIAGTSVDIARERTLAHVEMGPVEARLRQPLIADGAISASLASPQFRIVGEKGGQLGWRGLEATLGASDANAGRAGGTLRAETLRAADGLGGAAQLESLRWQWQPVPSMPGRFSAQLNGRVARTVINNQAYGAFRLESEIENLSLDAWYALVDQLGAMRDEGTGMLDPEARATLYGAIIPRALAGAPVLDIERLSLAAPSGDVRARLRVAAPERLREARLLADVISQLAVDFEAVLPASIARDVTVQVMLASGRSPYDIEESEIDRALAALVDDGLIESVDDDDAYRLRLTIDAGRLRLNGINQIGWQSVVDRFEAARERL